MKKLENIESLVTVEGLHKALGDLIADGKGNHNVLIDCDDWGFMPISDIKIFGDKENEFQTVVIS